MNKRNIQYTFSYTDQYDENSGNFPHQTNAAKTITVTDDMAWPVVMREFANFMSGIYGYNITEKLLIEEWDGDHASLSDF